MPRLELIDCHPTGEPRGDVLFVHGAWHGAWCWDDGFMERVAAAGYRCRALSLRGHGASESSGSIRWHRMSGYVADVAEALDGLSDAVVVAHSMGGYLAQKLLESRRPPAVALLAPVPVSGTLLATWRFARRHPVQYLKVVGQARLWPVVATPALAGDMLLSDSDHPDARALHERLQDESFLTYLQMMFFALPRPSRVGDPPPMMIFGGSDDRLFSQAQLAKTAARWGGELEVFDSMPHDLMLAPGWERVADSLVAWLDATVG